MKRRTLLMAGMICLALVVGFALGGCKDADDSTPLEGTWKMDGQELTFKGHDFNTKVDFGETSLYFKGSFSLSGDKITTTVSKYSADGKTWVDTPAEYKEFFSSEAQTYKIDGKTLTLGEGTFTKA